MDLLLLLTFGVTTLVLIVTAAVASRRLLGVRFGAIRLLLAGGITFAVSGPVARAILARMPGADDGTLGWLVILVAAISLLAAMAVLVIAEALVPTGSVPGPSTSLRTVRARTARLGRYLQILRTARRHGLCRHVLGRRAHAMRTAESRSDLARSLRLALTDSGATFVKLGQILSTRPDLLPPEFVRELSLLHDRVSPAPWEEVRAQLIVELGRPLEDCFVDFDPVPMAAASIAQVHGATLHDGTDVVVKIQRPGIRPVVERDLDLVETLARQLERSTGWARALGASDLASGLATAVREELDFRIEASNLDAMACVASGRQGDGVRYPLPFRPLCTDRVLVMDRLDGTPVSQIDGQPGEGNTALGRSLLEDLLRQILLSGVFHADPHPGNVLILDDGRVGLLDFGSVGRLDATVRTALGRLLGTLDRGDPIGATAALLDVTGEPIMLDEARLERDVGRFIARHLGPYTSSGAEMFGDLYALSSAHGLAVPREVAAVFRSLATVEGTLNRICPDFALVTETRMLTDHLGAGRVEPRVAAHSLGMEIAALLPTLRRLPRHLDRLVTAAGTGQLAITLRPASDGVVGGGPAAAALHPMLLTILSATAGIMGVLLLGTPNGPMMTDQIGLYPLIAYTLLTVCAVLGMRVLALVFRHGG